MSQPPLDQDSTGASASVDAEWVFEKLLTPALSVAKELPKARATPETLFHFTSAEGLLGILKSRSVWASLSTSLNDASERVYAMDVVKDVVGGGVPGVAEQFLNSVTGILVGERPEGIDVDPMRAFVASFCDAENASSQWLHYGRSGTGFALAFAGPKLASEPFFLTAVEYSEAVQRELVADVFRRVDANIPEVGARIGHDKALRIAAVMALAGIELLSPCLKSESFASEREWRLISYQLVSNPDAGPSTWTIT
jgi:hypothetical protein